MKKLLILFVLLLNGMSAIYGFKVDGINYSTISDEEVKVTGGNTSYSGRLELPSTVSYDGKEYVVTSIGDNAFSGCIHLTSINIPNSVTSIGNYAFSGCSDLTKITIPNSVTSIGYCTFRNCSRLSSVTIPNSVTRIGNQAFYNCSGLTYITIPNSVTSIGNQAFYNCSGLTSITIPNSVTSIGNEAFYNCSGLTSVTIPNSVTSIGGDAFFCCTGLTSVSFHCKEIGNWFSGNSSIKTVVIGDEVETIGRSAFSGFTGLTSVTIPNSVTSIGYYAFQGCSGLTSVTIPNSVTSIGFLAFAACSGLTSINIPNSVTSIGWDVFSGCSGLTEVTIPNSVTSIGERAFEGCSGLTSINIPNSVTSIGENAFAGCSSLTSINIPSSMTSIGERAFNNCSGLTEITIPNTVTSIGERAFNNCSGLTEITIPHTVTSIGRWAFSGCSSLTSVHITDLAAWCNNTFNNSPYGITNDVYSSNPLYYAHHLYINGEEVKDLVIPNSVTSIGAYAFSGCSGLTSVTIPSSVTSIGAYAFSGCSGLTEITIPNSVTSIGQYAFSGCSALTTVISQMKKPLEANTVFSNRANAVLYVRKGCKETYENASGWDFGEIIELTYATITISSAGVATYCPDGDLDFSEVEAFKAYIATAYDTQTHDVTMVRVYDVPAGTGLYLKGEAGTYTLPYTTSYSYYVNLLKGTLEPITLAQKEGNMTNFILSNGASGIGFYPLSKNGPFGADKAYLQVPTGTTYQGAKMLNLVFEESESTDIQEITADNGDDSYYSLTGVKVERPSKGIYIYKGKKVMIK